MVEVFIIKRTDTGQFYWGLTPTGDMLWTDNETVAQWFHKDGADAFIDRMNGQGNPKYDELELVLV